MIINSNYGAYQPQQAMQYAYTGMISSAKAPQDMASFNAQPRADERAAGTRDFGTEKRVEMRDQAQNAANGSKASMDVQMRLMPGMVDIYV